MIDEITIAFYLRVSSEDAGTGNESNSISNQRILLKFFLAETFKDKIYRISEFVDDGYSGTNLQRPAITKLLGLAGDGKIDCIIVKDFSRFSRDYIEIGSYLEQIFPFLGIRFISVNDHYDSSNYIGKFPQLDTVFQHLINDFYAKDISVKVRSSLDTKKAQGIYVNGSTPFGYKKSPADCHLLTPVEPEAGIVRRIFQMTLEGYSSSQIAKQLNREGIKTPIEHKIARGIAAMKPKGEKFIWDGSTICQMLRNDFYAGDLVYGKYETTTVGGKARLKPRKEWKLYKNHHEAIIDRSTYELVQQSRGKVKHVPRRKKHPLTGKMVCGYCRKSLKMAHSLNPYFFCPARYQTDSPECAVQIEAALAEQIILHLFHQEVMRQTDGDEIQKLYMEALREKCKKLLHERKQLLKEKNQLQEEKLRAYEEYKKKELTRNQYLEIQKPLQDKEDKLLAAVAKQEKRLQKTEKDLAEITESAADVWRKSKITGLDLHTADMIVNQIKIWDENHMEIIWNFREPAALKNHNRPAKL